MKLRYVSIKSIFAWLILSSSVQNSSTCLVFKTITKSAYNSTDSSTEKLLKDKAAGKYQGLLTIQTTSKVFFKDKYYRNTDNNVIYSSLGYAKSINCHFIKKNVYEGASFYLITSRGVVQEVWGLPIISPNKDKIAFFSKGMENAVGPNGIQIFAIEGHNITNKCTYEASTFEPMCLKWASNNVMYLKSIVPSNNGGITKYFKINIKK